MEEDLVSGAGGVESKAHGAISLPPALRKMREGRGTHFYGRAIERLGHPPGPPVCAHTVSNQPERLGVVTNFPETRMPVLEFLFSCGFHNSSSHLPRFLMAIVRVEVSTHSRENFLHLFSGLGFRDEQPATDATYTFDRFPLFHRFKKLKSSGRVAHGDSLAQVGPFRTFFILRTSHCSLL